jgi:hypothetical protein
VRYRDLSPLQPLTVKDLIYLDVFEEMYRKMERCKRLVFEDICFYLRHSGLMSISAMEMKHLPSYVAMLEMEMENRIKNK